MRATGARHGRYRLRFRRGQLALVAYDAYMRGVRERVRDLRPSWGAVLRIIKNYERLLFANEGQTGEHPRWAALSDNPIRFHGGLGYRTWKSLNYPGRRIGELTGKLKRQLTEGEGAYELREPTRLTFGSQYEDYGGVPGRPRSPLDRTAGNDIGGMHAEGRRLYYPMPARMPIRVTRPQTFEISDAIMDWVLEGLWPL